MPGPSAVPVELSAAEREVLEGWARRPKTAQALALRSRIVLACAGGGTNAQIAEDLGVTRGTVAKWRGRFATGRLEGLADEPRPGAPRKISDVQVEGEGDRGVAVDDLADVAGLRPQTAPGRDLEAVG